VKLLATLRAGLRGYENGTARVYARGGNTEVQYYQDFEGQSAVAPGTVINLDENGAALAYVDQLVTVQAWDENGVEASPFVEGDSADAVELISVGAEGTDYQTAAVGRQKPTTVAEQFSRWYSQNAAAFPKVLLGGVEKTILQVLGTLLPETFNVKATTYAGGATGDGVADDTVAILAAIAACQAAGGGYVYFPPGTYKVTSDLGVPPLVSLRGDGPKISVISLDACQAVFEGHATDVLPQEVAGLGWQFAATHTAQLCIFEQVAIVTFRSCYFNANSGSRCADGLVGSTVNGDVTFCYLGFYACNFRLPSSSEAATQDAIDLGAIDASKQVVECLWTYFQYRDAMSSGYAVHCKGAKLWNCELDLTATTAISSATYGLDGSMGGFAIGCNWIEPASFTGTYYCIDLPTSSSSDVFTESGCTFGSGNAPTTFLPYEGANPGGYLQSREPRYLVASGDDDAAFTADLLNFGSVTHERTNVGDQVISITKGPAGSRGRLTVVNGAAGTINLTWGTNISAFHGFEQLLTGETGTYEFEFYDDAGTVKARQVGFRDGIVGTLRIRQTGLSSGTVNHDFDIDAIWAAMPAASRFTVEVQGWFLGTPGIRQYRALYTLTTSGGAITAVDNNAGTFGLGGADTGGTFTASISSGVLRIAMAPGSGTISVARTQVKILETFA
jgi:hypothetical protein